MSRAIIEPFPRGLDTGVAQRQTNFICFEPRQKLIKKTHQLTTSVVLNPILSYPIVSYRIVSSHRPTGNHQAKCNTQPECGCEQKYKWHRLLVLDADKDRKPSQSALFMDWFLFPSACVCRCRAGNFSGKQFLKTVHQPGRTQQTPRDLRTNPAQSQLRLGP